MKEKRKKKVVPEINDGPKVISAASVVNDHRFSRRDFLRMAATTLAASAVVPILSSCDTTPATPSATNTPDLPQATANQDGVQILAGPGTVDQVVSVVGAGTLLYVISRDQTNAWYKVRTKENLEGWVDKNLVTVSASFQNRIDLGPVSPERPPIPTAEVVVPLPSPEDNNPSGPTILSYWYPN